MSDWEVESEHTVYRDGQTRFKIIIEDVIPFNDEWYLDLNLPSVPNVGDDLLEALKPHLSIRNLQDIVAAFSKQLEDTLEKRRECVRKTRDDNYKHSMGLEGMTQDVVDRIGKLVDCVDVDLDKPLDEGG